MPAAHHLRPLFQPLSVAVVGASREEKKLGHIIVRNIIESGFEGKVFPVNPKAEAVRGLSCYPEYSALPETPDLAIIAIPAAFILKTLEQISKKGTKHVVILSAGFKEIGDEGIKLEAEIVEYASKKGMYILGPNCLGFVTARHPINATFGQGIENTGNLRFISQSGAIATSIFDWSAFTGVGFSDFVTLGNKAVLAEHDILEYWLHETPLGSSDAELQGYHPVGLYLESITDGKKFLELAQKITKNSPMFMIKPGKSDAAKKAMQSHTGSLAGDDVVLSQALDEVGVIRCEGLEDVFDLSRLFAWTKAPTGPRIAVISNAGGPAVMSSDIIAAEGLELAEIDAATHRKLEKHLPRAASLVNPIDVLGDALADRYEQAIDTIFDEASVDAVLVLLTPQVMTQIEETASVIARLAKKHPKPIICSFMGGSQILKGEEILNAAHIPSFRFPERAIRALGKMWWWQNWRTEQEFAPAKKITSAPTKNLTTNHISKILKTAQKQKRTTLDNFETNTILDILGLNTPHTAVVKSFEEAELFTKNVGAPVVLKLSAPGLLHKADVGGVIAGIRTRDELKKAFSRLETASKKLSKKQDFSIQIQIQQQVESGIEVLVGIKRDPTFGSIVLIGAGGSLAEMVGDTQITLAPKNSSELKRLLGSTKIGTLLSGYRGSKAYAIDQLLEVIVQLQSLLHHDQLSEFEINPVIVTKDTAWVVDGKAVLSSTDS